MVRPLGLAGLRPLRPARPRPIGPDGVIPDGFTLDEGLSDWVSRSRTGSHWTGSPKAKGCPAGLAGPGRVLPGRTRPGSPKAKGCPAGLAGPGRVLPGGVHPGQRAVQPG